MQYVLKLVLPVIMAHKELRNDTWPYQIPLRDGFLLTPSYPLKLTPTLMSNGYIQVSVHLMSRRQYSNTPI